MANGQRINTEVLRMARLRKGWTFRDISERCEELKTPVDFGTVARYERGRTSPMPRKLLAIATALDLSVDDLLADTGDAKDPAA